MPEIDKLNQMILDSLPHWAMLIDVKTRTILAANKLALDGGAVRDCQCWDDFGHRQFISEDHKKMIEANPDRKRDNCIKCDFCLADEAMESGSSERKEVEIEGTIWETWWVPVDSETYLHYAINITDIRQTQKELEEALDNVKKLSGLLPICGHCKKIRDDNGYWNQIDAYIQEHSEAVFSHGICQDCAKKHYPDYDIYEE